jgi:hypothetical protein
MTGDQTMSEKQTIEEYHFRPWEVAEAFRAAGYDVPGTPSGMKVGSREDPETLVLSYVRCFDPAERGEPLEPTQDIIDNARLRPKRKCPITYGQECKNQYRPHSACRDCNTNLSTGVPTKFIPSPL